MKKRGIARGSFRMDGGFKWDLLDRIRKPGATEARKRMISRESNKDSLTDEVVKDYMGGRDAAARQAREYESLIKDIKSGKKHSHGSNSLAEAARERMIERQEQNSRYVDVGMDRANRRAYPAEGNRS